MPCGKGSAEHVFDALFLISNYCLQLSLSDTVGIRNPRTVGPLELLHQAPLAVGLSGLDRPLGSFDDVVGLGTEDADRVDDQARIPAPVHRSKLSRAATTQTEPEGFEWRCREGQVGFGRRSSWLLILSPRSSRMHGRPASMTREATRSRASISYAVTSSGCRQGTPHVVLVSENIQEAGPDPHL